MRLPCEIETAFRNGATILTANVRASRWLRHEYAIRRRAAGKRVWATPPIEDLEGWLRRLWQAYSLMREDSSLLLTSLQERRVWVRMQRDDAALLVSPEGMATFAEEAYALLSAYEAHAERTRPWLKSDAESFRQWAAHFDRECARHRWMSRGHLEARVTAAIAEGSVPLPRELVLVGFDRVTPVQRSLFAAIASRDVDLVHPRAGIDAAQVRCLRATDLREEITAAAWWTREHLESNPNARIGILVADLGAVRNEVERIFRRVLMPESDDIFASTRMPFEFSLGQPLATVPVVRAALLLLRWIAGPLQEEELSWMLLSGFLTATEAEHRALGRLDAALRDSGSLSLEITLPSVVRRIRATPNPVLEPLASRLEEARRAAAANRWREDARPPSRWADLAHLLLRHAGWPAGQRNDSAHFQALAKWEQLLEDIALLDFDGQQPDHREFLSILELRAGEAIFAIESQGAPVQIMGALEASGQHFDAAWMLGADDQSWPPRGRMHPLLPNDLQRQAGMPHGSAEVDWDLAYAVTSRIAACAPEVFFSYAQRNSDGEQRPSPILGHIAPAIAWEPATDLLQSREIGPFPHEMDEIVDDSGVIPWPRGQSAGGAEVLAYQAACPFQAFGRKRLAAAELSRNDWGLSGAQRGALLHKVLELLWSPESGRLHTLDDLLQAIKEGSLRETIEAAIREVFTRELSKDIGGDADPWIHAYLESEQRRLRLRLEEWFLEVEAKRVPFEVIACEEKLNDVSVAGLKLNLRADRIDELPDGSRLLIDYKSGEVSPAAWKSMRPSDPQLPLYAVFGNVRDLRGALFARIRAGKTGITGVLSDARAQLFAGSRPASALTKFPYTPEMREAWSAALLSLAEEFLRGEAILDPRDKGTTCERCPLPGLCRIAEHANLLDEEEDEVAESGE